MTDAAPGGRVILVGGPNGPAANADEAMRIVTATAATAIAVKRKTELLNGLIPLMALSCKLTPCMRI